MTDTQSRSADLKTIVTGLVVVAFSAVAVYWIYASEPEAVREGATKRTAMLVEVYEASQRQYRPKLTALGEVKAAQSVSLRARVEGEVVAVSEAFVPGNIVEKGQWLIRIDPSDYELALTQARARLNRIQAAYEIELGEQEAARREFNSLNRDVSELNRSLILRQPQRQQAEANLVAAKADVRAAELALERTVVRMPFDGQILTQSVNLGSMVAGADVVADVVGSARYWIRAQVPMAQLKWVDAQTTGVEERQPVVVHNPTAWPEGSERQGYLKQVIAKLDPQTRMATVLVEVTDPLALQQPDLPMLTEGAYVRVALPVKPIDSAVRLPLSYLRKQNTVWVKNDKKLEIRDVTLAFKDEQYAYITEGIKDGESVIITDLSNVTDGAAVRLSTDDAEVTSQ